MKVDRIGFQAFVGDMAVRKDDVPEICNRMTPFFDIVDRRAYPLGMADGALYGQAVTAVRGLLADDAAQVCAFSVSRPFDAPTWMTDAVYVESVRESLGREVLGSEFLMRIVAGQQDAAVRAHVAEVTRALNELHVWMEFAHAMNEAVDASFRSRVFDETAVRTVQTGVQDLLRAYLTAAVADARFRDAIAAAVDVLPQCIPLCRRSSASCKNVITLFA